MTVAFYFAYTCTGSEGSDFLVTMPAVRDTSTYAVTRTLSGVTNILGIDLPNGAAVAGVGDSLAVASGVVTLTDAAGLFTSANVGRSITITGATNPANNGVFRIRSFVSATQITYSNVSGIAETSSLNWSIADRTTSTFRVVATAAPPANDRIEFSIRDPGAVFQHIPATGARDIAGVHSTPGAYFWQIAANTNPLVFPIALRVGEQITGYALYLKKATNNTNTVTADIYHSDGTAGTEASEGVASSSSANAPGFVTLSLATGISILSNRQYYLKFTPGGGAAPAADLVYFLEIGYTAI